MTGLLAHVRRLRRLGARLRAVVWSRLHPGVTVGARARVGRDCRLIMERDARLTLGPGCEVDDACTVAVYGPGRIELGPGAFVGHHCTLAAHSSIRIGAGTYLAELVSIRDHDHAVGLPPSSGESTTAAVEIGSDVWIGAKATILRGAVIGSGAVVGANAVVRGEIPARSVCAGVPARVVRHLDDG